MSNIAARHAAVTVTVDGIDGEPTVPELDAIEREMPVILADVDLLNAQIITLDRTPTELDARRIRRAHRRALAARVALLNSSEGTGWSGGAA